MAIRYSRAYNVGLVYSTLAIGPLRFDVLAVYGSNSTMIERRKVLHRETGIHTLGTNESLETANKRRRKERGEGERVCVKRLNHEYKDSQ